MQAGIPPVGGQRRAQADVGLRVAGVQLQRLADRVEPAVLLAQVAQGAAGVAQPERGVERHAPDELRARLGHRVGPPSLMGDRTDGLVVLGPCIQVLGTLAPDVRDLRAGQLGLGLRDDAAGEFVTFAQTVGYAGA
jgi:hypothetical protein